MKPKTRDAPIPMVFPARLIWLACGSCGRSVRGATYYSEGISWDDTVNVEKVKCPKCGECKLTEITTDVN